MKKIKIVTIVMFVMAFCSLNFVSAADNVLKSAAKEYAKVPNLVNKDYQLAEEQLIALGLVPVLEYDTCKDKAAGTVMSQGVSSGTRLVKGEKVTITICSSGIRYPSAPSSGTQTITGVTNLADRIWATAITIVQVLAVGSVIFAGLRYMYASADKKADIKKGMMYLAIGSIFVFATTTVIRFIYNAGSSLL